MKTDYEFVDYQINQVAYADAVFITRTVAADGIEINIKIRRDGVRMGTIIMHGEKMQHAEIVGFHVASSGVNTRLEDSLEAPTKDHRNPLQRNEENMNQDEGAAADAYGKVTPIEREEEESEGEKLRKRFEALQETTESLFDEVTQKNALSKRRDLCALLILDRLEPGSTEDILTAAETDCIFFSIGLTDFLAANPTDDDIRDLIRCGVFYDDGTESFGMYC